MQVRPTWSPKKLLPACSFRTLHLLFPEAHIQNAALPWERHPLHLQLSVICSTRGGGGGRQVYLSQLMGRVQLNDASRALLASVPEVSN